jgi:alpha-galactosidase
MWKYQSWMPATGNLWRIADDITDKWDNGTQYFHGIINCIDLNRDYASNAAPGAWNDPDMLEIGNGGCTTEEYRTQMSMWCIMASPLIAGNDIRTMKQEIKDILLNKEVIAINQDSAGIQGTRKSAVNNLEIWCKPLDSVNSTTKAVALLNRSATAANITVKFSDIGLTGTVIVRDLWAKADKGDFTGSYTMSVPSHGTGLLKISSKDVVSIASRRSVSDNGKRFKTELCNGKLVLTPFSRTAGFSVRVFAANGKLVATAGEIADVCRLSINGKGVFIVCISSSGLTERSVVSKF